MQAASPPLPLRPAFAAEPGKTKAPPGQPRRADGRLREPMSAPGGGISRLVSPRLARVARAAQAGTAAAPGRETRLGLTAAGGSAWGAVGGRRPPSSTMPGIDKLPIEETLEDSPQVRRGGGGYRRKERGGPTPGLGPRWPQVLALTPVGVAAQSSRPSRATPGAAEARPPTRGPRGPAPLGRELRAGSGTSRAATEPPSPSLVGLVVHVGSRGKKIGVTKQTDEEGREHKKRKFLRNYLG